MKNFLKCICFLSVAYSFLGFSFINSADVGPLRTQDKDRLIAEIRMFVPDQTIFNPANGAELRASIMERVRGYVFAVNSQALAEQFVLLLNADKFVSMAMASVGEVDAQLIESSGLIKVLEENLNKVRSIKAFLKAAHVSVVSNNLRDVLLQLAESLDAAFAKVLKECRDVMSGSNPVEEEDEDWVMVSAPGAKIGVNKAELIATIEDLFAKLNRSVDFADPHTTGMRLSHMISDIQRIVDMAKVDKFTTRWNDLQHVYNHLVAAVYALSDTSRTKPYSQQDFSEMKANLIEGQSSLNTIITILGKDTFRITTSARTAREVLKHFAGSLRAVLGSILERFDSDVALLRERSGSEEYREALLHHPRLQKHKRGELVTQSYQPNVVHVKNVICSTCLKPIPSKDYVVLPCEHAVHTECMQEHGGTICPKCTKPF